MLKDRVHRPKLTVAITTEKVTLFFGGFRFPRKQLRDHRSKKNVASSSSYVFVDAPGN